MISSEISRGASTHCTALYGEGGVKKAHKNYVYDTQFSCLTKPPRASYRTGMKKNQSSFITRLSVVLLALCSIAAVGFNLDTQFGDNGTVRISFNEPGMAEKPRLVHPRAEGGYMLAWVRTGGTLAGGRNLDPMLMQVAFTTAGALDESFGVDGIAATPIPVEPALMQGGSVFADPSGGYVVFVFSMSAPSTLKQARVFKFDSDGRVDRNFLPSDIQDTNGYPIFIADLAVGDDGSVFLLAAEEESMSASKTKTNTVVSKILPTGGYDLSFSGDGKQRLTLPNRSLRGRSLAVFTDGAVVVAGASSAPVVDTGGLILIDDTTNSFIFKLKPDGTLDTGFAGGGLLNVAASANYDRFNEIFITPTQTIVAVGTANISAGGSPDDRRMSQARFSAAGVPVSTFNSGLPLVEGSALDIRGQLITMDAQSRIVIAGSSRDHIEALRFRENGVLDSIFASGRFHLPVQSDTVGVNIEEVPSALWAGGGTIVVAGMRSEIVPLSPASRSLMLITLNNEGVPLDSFSTDGVAYADVSAQPYALVAAPIASTEYINVFARHYYSATPPFGQRFTGFGQPVDSTPVSIFAFPGVVGATVDSDNRIVVLASSATGSIDVLRGAPDGAVDTTFNALGTPGRTALPAEVNDVPTAVAMGDTGAIWVAGYAVTTNASIWVTRLRDSGLPDTGFSGDGSTRILLDGLDMRATSVLPLSDGGALVLGSITSLDSSDLNALALRYQFNGEYVNSFGVSGGFQFDIAGEDDVVTTAGVHGDGFILGINSNRVGTPMAVIARMTNAGALDVTFGTAGHIELSYGDWDALAGLVVLGDSRVVVGLNTLTQWGRESSLVMLKSDGSLDTSFGIAGRQVVDPTDDYGALLRTLNLSPTGKRLVMGFEGLSSVWLMRDALNFGNTAPEIAGLDTLAFTMDEDDVTGALEFWLKSTDADGDAVRWRTSSDPSNGSVSIERVGNSKVNLSYVPAVDFYGTDAFTLEVADAFSGTDSVQVTVAVAPQNDPPEFTVQPNITGIPQVGMSIEVEYEANDNRDGGSTLTPAFTWFRADDASGTGEMSIPLADTPRYLVTEADRGKFLRAEVRVTDDGVGLPAVAVVAAFSPYARVSSYTLSLDRIEVTGIYDGAVVSVSVAGNTTPLNGGTWKADVPILDGFPLNLSIEYTTDSETVSVVDWIISFMRIDL